MELRHDAHDEPAALKGTALYRDYLQAARKRFTPFAGLSPGRLLLPTMAQALRRAGAPSRRQVQAISARASLAGPMHDVACSLVCDGEESRKPFLGRDFVVVDEGDMRSAHRQCGFDGGVAGIWNSRRRLMHIDGAGAVGVQFSNGPLFAAVLRIVDDNERHRAIGGQFLLEHGPGALEEPLGPVSRTDAYCDPHALSSIESPEK